ncbi:Hypothetical predicted protein [Prunus dulcis]|uniref:hydroxymethylglutaryl-CoA reductase (NADPH) n=1 Tax=Prunus dulcis TaxID=3755 RepID=A0A5E4GH07_PRUDU|nr:Hypothetical predicted protein [Prunus dulcis]
MGIGSTVKDGALYSKGVNKVGAIGGGTQLASQSACLNLLGMKGANRESPGANARIGNGSSRATNPAVDDEDQDPSCLDLKQQPPPRVVPLPHHPRLKGLWWQRSAQQEDANVLSYVWF